MGNVIRFPRRHVRTSDAVGCAAANASKVMCAHPRSAASRTMSDQRRGGIPRARQELTVEAGNPSSAQTAAVPPKSLMVESEVNIESIIVRTLRTSQVFADCETTFPVVYSPIESMAGPLTDPPEIIGPRLRALRIALKKKSQTEFATDIGVEKNTYNPWETGKRPLTFEGALLIRKKFKIPLEYLFFGEFADELPYRIRQAINRAA